MLTHICCPVEKNPTYPPKATWTFFLSVQVKFTVILAWHECSTQNPIDEQSWEQMINKKIRAYYHKSAFLYFVIAGRSGCLGWTNRHVGRVITKITTSSLSKTKKANFCAVVVFRYSNMKERESGGVSLISIRSLKPWRDRRERSNRGQKRVHDDRKSLRPDTDSSSDVQASLNTSSTICTS